MNEQAIEDHIVEPTEQANMTDLKLFQTFLTQTGLAELVEDPNVVWKDTNVYSFSPTAPHYSTTGEPLRPDKVIGYPYFYAQFHFDDNGKFDRLVIAE